MPFSAYVIPGPERHGLSIDNLRVRETPLLLPWRWCPLVRKMVMVMKLTAVFLLAFTLHLSARTYSQTVTLSFKDAPLSRVFSAIQKMTGYTFTYFMEDVAGYKASFRVSGATIEETMQVCLKGVPLTYVITEGNKNISIRKSVAMDKEAESLPGQEVNGQVDDEDGSSISGATITVKGTKQVIAADSKGRFILTGLDENAILVISCVGYETMEMPLKGRAQISVKLRRKSGPLDEVEVIAYGTTTERYSTGNVNTVSSKEIEEQPVTDPLLALEGRVPGLLITQSTGFANSGVTVRIQGQNSINNGNDPLYVIDGVPYISQLLPTLNYILGTSGGSNSSNSSSGNPMSFINPFDIESISILKDADATAIYGSRAANGAILITTKKGKAGLTKVDINLQDGCGSVPHFIDLMNTPQYLQMRHEAFALDGLTPGPTDYDVNGFWDSTRSINWQKTLIGNIAQYTNAQASVSAGTANTQFLVGAGYHRETTVFPGDLADQKGSLHFCVNHVSSNQNFRLQLTGSYMADNNRLIATDLTGVAQTLAPDAPPIYNKNGTLNWAPDANANSSWENPLSNYLEKYNNQTNNLTSNALVSYQLMSGLNIKSSFGYTNLQSNEVQIIPSAALAPEDRPFFHGQASYGNSNINSWIIEPQVDYNRKVSRGKLDVLVGSTINQQNSNGEHFKGKNYTSDLLLYDIADAASISANSITSTIYRYNAVFGRINYNWQNRYIIDLTERLDGSSRFGSANQFHDFESAGAAWIFSDEDVFRKNLIFLSFGKLRASYGTTGNDQIGDYQFLNQYSTIGVPVAYQGVTGLQPNGLPNLNLQWEETRKLNFAMDLGFLKDRIILNINYSRNRSSNQLLPYALPIFTGNSSIEENFPATVQNTNWEFMISIINVKSRNFRWSSSINLTLPQNKLIAFPNLDSSSYAYSYVIGQPVSIIRTFKYLGVNSTTGVYQFASSQGMTSSPNAPVDQNVLVNTLPKFYGGFQNSFNYKGFQLDVLFQFVKQTGYYPLFGNYPGYFSSNGGGNSGNQPGSLLSNNWKQQGDVALIQRFSTGFSYAQAFSDAETSNAAFTDASYIRLKNVSFSWQLPHNWDKSAHLQNAQLFVQGQNLLTITKFPSLDPESQGTTTLPPLRVITIGVQITL